MVLKGQRPLSRPVKTRMLGPHSRGSQTTGLGWDPQKCTCNRFPGGLVLRFGELPREPMPALALAWALGLGVGGGGRLPGAEEQALHCKWKALVAGWADSSGAPFIKRSF